MPLRAVSIILETGLEIIFNLLSPFEHQFSMINEAFTYFGKNAIIFVLLIQC